MTSTLCDTQFMRSVHVSEVCHAIDRRQSARLKSELPLSLMVQTLNTPTSQPGLLRSGSRHPCFSVVIPGQPDLSKPPTPVLQRQGLRTPQIPSPTSVHNGKLSTDTYKNRNKARPTAQASFQWHEGAPHPQPALPVRPPAQRRMQPFRHELLRKCRAARCSPQPAAQCAWAEANFRAHQVWLQ